MRLFENGSDRIRGSHQNDGLRICRFHDVDRATDLRGLPLVGSRSDRFSVMGLQRGKDGLVLA